MTVDDGGAVFFAGAMQYPTYCWGHGFPETSV
jgi:hypothetical protein